MFIKTMVKTFLLGGMSIKSLNVPVCYSATPKPRKQKSNIRKASSKKTMTY